MQRDPPANLDAERALLGTLMLFPERCADVADLVEPADFFKPTHGYVYEAILACRDEGSASDPVLVASVLRARGREAAVGGVMPFLAELVSCGSAGELARHHARLVRAESVRRAIIAAVSKVGIAAFARQEDPADLLSALAAAVSELTPRTLEAAGGIADLVDLVRAEAVEAFEGRRFRLSPNLHPIADEVIPSVGAGEMLVIGARPKVGKSNLIGDLVFGWARGGSPGVICTLEDSPNVWTAREIAKLSGGELDAEDLRSGTNMNAAKWSLYDQLAPTVKALPVQILDVRGQKASAIAARIEAAGRRGAKWAAVDYLQLIAPSQFKRGASQQDETASVVKELKDACGRAKVALVLASQLRRAPPDQAEPRPTANDLRNSGMIEAQADAVVLLWRRKRKDYAHCTIIRELWKYGQPTERALIWMPNKRYYAPLPVKAVPVGGWRGPSDDGDGGDDGGFSPSE